MGMQELVLIGIIALLLFGANKLPELFRALGTSIVEFKKAVNETKPMDPPPPAPPSTPPKEGGNAS